MNLEPHDERRAKKNRTKPAKMPESIMLHLERMAVYHDRHFSPPRPPALNCRCTLKEAALQDKTNVV